LRIYNRYLATLAVVFTAVNVSMAAVGQSSLDAHFTVLVLAALVVSLLFASFSPRARRALSAASIAFFAGFLVIVALRVVDILKAA
jgi:hypothetical protein